MERDNEYLAVSRTGNRVRCNIIILHLTLTWFVLFDAVLSAVGNTSLWVLIPLLLGWFGVSLTTRAFFKHFHW